MEGLNLRFCKQKCFSEYSPALVTPTCDGTFSDLRLPQVVFFTILSDFADLRQLQVVSNFPFFRNLRQPQVGPKRDLRQFRRPKVPSQVEVLVDLRLPQVGKK